MNGPTTSAFALIVFLSETAAAQGGAREHMLDMAGCFDVTYYFHEDGEHDYLNPEKPPALVNEEFIAVTDDDPGRLVLQHATIGEGGRAVPHWHQVWTQGEGGWTQSVFGRTPGDEDRQLRYRCTAPWSMNEWACVIGAAPKPFRDSGAPFGFFREDYDHLFEMMRSSSRPGLASERAQPEAHGGRRPREPRAWLHHLQQMGRGTVRSGGDGSIGTRAGGRSKLNQQPKAAGLSLTGAKPTRAAARATQQPAR